MKSLKSLLSDVIRYDLKTSWTDSGIYDYLEKDDAGSWVSYEDVLEKLNSLDLELRKLLIGFWAFQNSDSIHECPICNLGDKLPKEISSYCPLIDSNHSDIISLIKKLLGD